MDRKHEEAMKLAPQDFFDTYSPVAVSDSVFTGIPPSIKLAQAALESGWGGSGLSSNANNFFGIKSHNWGGAEYNASTQEYFGGYTTIKSNFRAYGSPYESFMDHSKFLKENPRYSSLFDLDPLDYRGWAYGLKEAGYATAPDYPEKLINLVEKYNLQQYDLKAESKRSYKQLAWILAIGLTVVVAGLVIRKLLKA